jgi:hypothetical protein
VYRLLNAKKVNVVTNSFTLGVDCGRKQLLDVKVQQIDI